MYRAHTPTALRWLAPGDELEVYMVFRGKYFHLVAFTGRNCLAVALTMPTGIMTFKCDMFPSCWPTWSAISTGMNAAMPRRRWSEYANEH